MKKQTLKEAIYTKIKRSRKEVFLRADFVKSGDYDQVGRALRQLSKEGVVIKLGYGLYAKARMNRITQQPMLAAKGGFEEVATEALTRLNVKWEPSPSKSAYLSGSTQIPANPEVVVYDRINRRIATDKYELKIRSGCTT